MFRTRDFILLFSAIMFLVMAIGTTLINQKWSSDDTAFVLVETENSTEYIAMVASSEEINRAEKVAQMRSKISQQTLLTNEVAQEAVEDVIDDDAPTSSPEVTTESAAVLCPSYRPYTSFWDARDLTLMESEGARILSRGEISPTSIPELVLQLPVRTVPSGNPSCLSSDVIGIANDGSLIRNDEVALYGIFSADALIGYALDGFPIYGSGNGAGDACGGVTTPSGYRYELSSERDTMINCFAAAPVLLP